MTHMSVDVPDELAAWLQHRADERGVDVSEALASALEISRDVADHAAAVLHARKVTDPALRALAEA